MRVNVQPTFKMLRRLHSLATIAIEKGGEDRVRISGAITKILLDCFDETYEAIGRDAALLDKLHRLDLTYGYEDEIDALAYAV